MDGKKQLKALNKDIEKSIKAIAKKYGLVKTNYELSYPHKGLRLQVEIETSLAIPRDEEEKEYKYVAFFRPASRKAFFAIKR